MTPEQRKEYERSKKKNQRDQKRLRLNSLHASNVCVQTQIKKQDQEDLV